MKMELTHLLNVEEVIIEERNEDGNYKIYANGHRGFTFIMIIPILGNLMALIWWLSTFGKKYEYVPKKPKNIKGNKIIYSSY